MNKHLNFWYLLFAMLAMLSCANHQEISNLSAFISDTGNGLSKPVLLDGNTMQLSVWPTQLLGKKSGKQDLAYFELTSDNTHQLFTMSEMNFKMESRGESLASIVVAENLGDSRRNRLLIGFPKEFTTKGNLRFHFLDNLGISKTSVVFHAKDLKKLRNIEL